MNVYKIYLLKLFIIFPPYHIEAAQTPVCVVSVFLRGYVTLHSRHAIIVVTKVEIKTQAMGIASFFVFVPAK